MAPTTRSYVIAATNAIVLPTSNAYHAQLSPRWKAVAVIAIASSATATPYAPYTRKGTVISGTENPAAVSFAKPRAFPPTACWLATS